MSDNIDHLLQNKSSWNSRVPIHLNSEFYNIDRFKRLGNSLNSIEIDGLGDVNKKSILHLQCHFGQDTLSLSSMGADVTGIDFSSSAIAAAKSFAKELGISADFIEHDVLNLSLQEEFDIVFTSYGVLGWLPSLNDWARTVYSHLKKGGIFFMVEFHPFIALLDEESQYNYFYDPYPDIEENYGSYTDGGKDVLIKSCWWNHSLSEVFESLELAGLKLLDFKEFDYSPYCLENMIEKDIGKYVLSEREHQSLPYVFSLKAIKK